MKPITDRYWFVEQVLAALPAISRDDRVHIILGIQRMHRDGFTVNDAIAFNLLLDEVMPGLDEKKTCEGMWAIASKYIHEDGSKKGNGQL